MSDKNRERKCNKEKYKRKQKKKKLFKQERKSRAPSRERRNNIRHSIKPYYDAFRNFNEKHILFVLKDTDNMERILLQRKNIDDRNVLLILPTINEQMIIEYMSSAQVAEESETSITRFDNEWFKGLVRHFYSVCSNNFIDMPEMNMIIFTDCKLIERKDDLIPINVRPYNLNTWYNGELTSLDGFRIYSGKKLKTFFYINDNLGKTYVFHDTLVQILLYRSLKGKITSSELLLDHKQLAKKKFLKIGSLYAIMATDFKELKQRFGNEEQENIILNEHGDVH